MEYNSFNDENIWIILTEIFHSQNIMWNTIAELYVWYELVQLVAEWNVQYNEYNI